MQNVCRTKYDAYARYRTIASASVDSAKMYPGAFSPAAASGGREHCEGEHHREEEHPEDAPRERPQASVTAQMACVQLTVELMSQKLVKLRSVSSR